MANRSMPTAARLVAAISLAIASAAMVIVLAMYYPDAKLDRYMPNIFFVFGGLGALVGWYSLGKRVEAEQGIGIGLGIRAALTTMAWIILALGISFVIMEILDNKFRGLDPMDAIGALVKQWVILSAYLFHAKVFGIAIGMGIISGLLTRNAYEKWR